MNNVNQKIALGRVRKATKAKARAASALWVAEKAWRATILDAIAAGASHRQIEPYAGVSYARVGQVSAEELRKLEVEQEGAGDG